MASGGHFRRSSFHADVLAPRVEQSVTTPVACGETAALHMIIHVVLQSGGLRVTSSGQRSLVDEAHQGDLVDLWLENRVESGGGSEAALRVASMTALTTAPTTSR